MGRAKIFYQLDDYQLLNKPYSPLTANNQISPTSIYFILSLPHYYKVQTTSSPLICIHLSPIKRETKHVTK